MPGRSGEKIIFLLIVCLITLADFISKRLFLNVIGIGESVPLIKGLFHLTVVPNTGSAFGILKSFPHVFTFFSAIAVVALFILLLKLKNAPISVKLSLALILSGALGNLIDRVTLGFIVDFIDFRIWPVFNLADTAITIGVSVLIWKLYLKKPIKAEVK